MEEGTSAELKSSLTFTPLLPSLMEESAPAELESSLTFTPPLVPAAAPPVGRGPSLGAVPCLMEEGTATELKSFLEGGPPPAPSRPAGGVQYDFHAAQERRRSTLSAAARTTLMLFLERRLAAPPEDRPKPRPAFPLYRQRSTCDGEVCKCRGRLVIPRGSSAVLIGAGDPAKPWTRCWRTAAFSPSFFEGVEPVAISVSVEGMRSSLFPGTGPQFYDRELLQNLTFGWQSGFELFARQGSYGLHGEGEHICCYANPTVRDHEHVNAQLEHVMVEAAAVTSVLRGTVMKDLVGHSGVPCIVALPGATFVEAARNAFGPAVVAVSAPVTSAKKRTPPFVRRLDNCKKADPKRLSEFASDFGLADAPGLNIGVNQGIAKDESPILLYANEESLRRLIVTDWEEFHMPVFMCKWDMVAFYRVILPVFLAHIPLLCFFFAGMGYFANLFWPFGGRPAAFYAQRCMNALVWYLAVRGYTCCGMIDDLTVLSHEGDCDATVEFVDSVLVLWKWPKNMVKWLIEGGFGRAREWQGRWFDLSGPTLDDWTISLSEERREEFLLELGAWATRDSGSFTELRSFFHKTVWVTSVVENSIVWTYFILDAYRRAERSRSNYAALRELFHQDVQQLSRLVRGLRGHRMWRPMGDRQMLEAPLLMRIVTDAATKHGTGGGGHFFLDETLYVFEWTWSPEERALIAREYDGTPESVERGKPLTIHRLEFHTMGVGAIVAMPLLKGRAIGIELVGDNMPSVQVLERGRSRTDPVVAIMHHQLVLAAARHNVEFRSAFVRGIDNHLADALSRQDKARVTALTHGFRVVELQVPASCPARKGLLQAFTSSSAPR